MCCGTRWLSPGSFEGLYVSQAGSMWHMTGLHSVAVGGTYLPEVVACCLSHA